MGKSMASLGGFLLIAAIVSSALHFTNYELRIFMWIYTWGENMAWAIRGGAALLGIILMLIGSKMDDEGAKA